MNIDIKYFNDLMTKIEEGGNNWIDLRCSNTTKSRKDTYVSIPLGVAINIPEGYELHIILRDKAFKKYGIMQPGGVLVIEDNSNWEQDKEIEVPVLFTKDSVVNFNDRFCKFRLVEKQPVLEFNIL